MGASELISNLSKGVINGVAVGSHHDGSFMHHQLGLGIWFDEYNVNHHYSLLVHPIEGTGH